MLTFIAYLITKAFFRKIFFKKFESIQKQFRFFFSQNFSIFFEYSFTKINDFDIFKRNITHNKRFSSSHTLFTNNLSFS